MVSKKNILFLGLICIMNVTKSSEFAVTNPTTAVAAGFAIFVAGKAYMETSKKYEAVKTELNSNEKVDTVDTYEGMEQFIGENKSKLLKNNTGGIKLSDVIQKINEDKSIKDEFDKITSKNKEISIPSHLRDLVLFGQFKVFHEAQKIFFRYSIAEWLGIKAFEFKNGAQDNALIKTGATILSAAALIWQFPILMFCLCPPLIVPILCYPLLKNVIIGLHIKNVNFGIHISEKYRNGLLGFILHYFKEIKKRADQI